MKTKAARSRFLKGAASAAALSAGLLIAAPSAHATSDSATWNIPGGNKMSVNAWHCGTYVSACDWKASTKMKGSNPKKAQWIKNVADLQAHGVSVSIKISKNPEASLKMVSKSLGRVTWKNTKTWISDTSGQMRPSKLTTYVSTKSCGSAQITSKVKFSTKCVYAGAA